MPTRFKGTRLEVSRVEISGHATGPRITAGIQFCDANGLVHATTRHELEPGVDPQIEAATKALLDSLKKWAEKLHYEDAEGIASGRMTVGGIAESLRGDADPDEGSGSQG